MHPYPHTYEANATGSAAGLVSLQSVGLPPLSSAPPAQFNGPGDAWSPETLLVAAIADCFLLTLRLVAHASNLDWVSVHCAVEGTLDRVGGVTLFTRYVTRATLTLPTGADAAKARTLLERAEKLCLITNSLKGERLLETTIVNVAP